MKSVEPGYCSSVRPNVALISLPWAPVKSPPLALGRLKASLLQQDILCDCYYLSKSFYRQLCNSLHVNLSTLIDNITDSEENLDMHLFFGDIFDKKLLKNNEQIARIYDEFQSLTLKMLEEHAWGSYTWVGFTCTFNQLYSSLFFAKLMKKKFPGINILLGGAIFDEEIAETILGHLPWIHSIFLGESEMSLPKFLKSDKLPLGVMTRSGNQIVFEGKSFLSQDEFCNLPPPNLDEFYNNTKNNLCPLEASRGCWRKPICSFCGMVQHKVYRIKKNFLDDIKFVQKKYKISHIEFVDLVFPSKLISALKPSPLVTLNFRVDSIKQTSLNILKTLPIKSIFIGIESFHPLLLKKMKKGHLAIDSISVLKWSKFYNIKINWFLLFGVRGSCPQHYRELLTICKKVSHLDSPKMQPIQVVRNSPDYEEFKSKGLLIPPKNLRNHYSNDVLISKLAWSFELNDVHYIVENISSTKEIKDLVQFTALWRATNQDRFLIQRGNEIIDNRMLVETTTRLINNEISLLNYCFIPQKKENVNTMFSQSTINRMTGQDFLIDLDNKYLSLVIPENDLVFDAQHNEVT